MFLNILEFLLYQHQMFLYVLDKVAALSTPMFLYILDKDDALSTPNVSVHIR